MPKLKTHGQMTLTLGVKNMFGAVPGTRKTQWHLAAGADRMHFARMLVDLYRKVSPELTLMDGIVGMQGNGPQNGDPRKLGVIVASEDAVALDAVVCEMLGLKRERMATILAAEEMGAGQSRLGRISVAGEALEDCMVADFVFPSMSDLMNFCPPFLRETMRDWLTTRPVLDSGLCKMCLVCVDNCPAKVITPHGKTLRFELKQCIRCFCCQEMCPEGAIEVGSGPLARLLRL
jgi:ferredoxin